MTRRRTMNSIVKRSAPSSRPGRRRLRIFSANLASDTRAPHDLWIFLKNAVLSALPTARSRARSSGQAMRMNSRENQKTKKGLKKNAFRNCYERSELQVLNPTHGAQYRYERSSSLRSK